MLSGALPSSRTTESLNYFSAWCAGEEPPAFMAGKRHSASPWHPDDSTRAILSELALISAAVRYHFRVRPATSIAVNRRAYSRRNLNCFSVAELCFRYPPFRVPYTRRIGALQAGILHLPDSDRCPSLRYRFGMSGCVERTTVLATVKPRILCYLTPHYRPDHFDHISPREMWSDHLHTRTNAIKCVDLRSRRTVAKLLSGLEFLRLMACTVSPLLTARS